jgi:hypothetical protein
VIVDMANLDATPEDKAALVNDEIRRIMSSAGVAHSVAIHAAIVAGGNFSLAEKYLKLQLPLTEPASKHAETHGLWGVADDFTLINHEAVFRYYMEKHGLKSFPKLDRAAVAKADPDSGTQTMNILNPKPSRCARLRRQGRPQLRDASPNHPTLQNLTRPW